LTQVNVSDVHASAYGLQRFGGFHSLWRRGIAFVGDICGAIVVLVALVMAISGSRLARHRAIAVGSPLPGMAAIF
jgi:hypothetical protein